MAKKPIDKKPELGDVVRDKVTGFEGVVIAYTTWLNGCERLGVQPKKLDKDGKPRAYETFDIQQLEVVEAGTHVLEPEPPKGAVVKDPPVRTGGDRENVRPGRETPRR